MIFEYNFRKNRVRDVDKTGPWSTKSSTSTGCTNAQCVSALGSLLVQAWVLLKDPKSSPWGVITKHFDPTYVPLGDTVIPSIFRLQTTPKNTYSIQDTLDQRKLTHDRLWINLNFFRVVTHFWLYFFRFSVI